MGEPGFEIIEGLRVSDALCRGLASDGISHPTEVQRIAIPLILAGRSVMVQSSTATGKTLACLTPGPNWYWWVPPWAQNLKPKSMISHPIK